MQGGLIDSSPLLLRVMSGRLSAEFPDWKVRVLKLTPVDPGFQQQLDVVIMHPDCKRDLGVSYKIDDVSFQQSFSMEMLAQEIARRIVLCFKEAIANGVKPEEPEQLVCSLEEGMALIKQML